MVSIGQQEGNRGKFPLAWWGTLEGKSKQHEKKSRVHLKEEENFPSLLEKAGKSVREEGR